jgi:hypothetical protein
MGENDQPVKPDVPLRFFEDSGATAQGTDVTFTAEGAPTLTIGNLVKVNDDGIAAPFIFEGNAIVDNDRLKLFDASGNEIPLEGGIGFQTPDGKIRLAGMDGSLSIVEQANAGPEGATLDPMVKGPDAIPAEPHLELTAAQNELLDQVREFVETKRKAEQDHFNEVFEGTVQPETYGNQSRARSELNYDSKARKMMGQINDIDSQVSQLRKVLDEVANLMKLKDGSEEKLEQVEKQIEDLQSRKQALEERIVQLQEDNDLLAAAAPHKRALKPEMERRIAENNKLIEKLEGKLEALDYDSKTNQLRAQKEVAEARLAELNRELAAAALLNLTGIMKHIRNLEMERVQWVDELKAHVLGPLQQEQVPIGETAALRDAQRKSTLDLPGKPPWKALLPENAESLKGKPAPGEALPEGVAKETDKLPGEAKELDRKQIIDEYVKLLRAKDKLLQGKKSKAILAREKDIRDNFKALVDQDIAGKDADGRRTAIGAIYTELTNQLHNSPRFFDRELRRMRKPSWAISRGVIGAGLLAAGLLTGGIASVVLLTGAGIVGAIGRYIGMTAVSDLVHSKLMGRAGRGADGLGVQVAHTSGENVQKRLAKVFTDAAVMADDVSASMDNGMIKAFKKYRTWKVWKTLAAAAFAVVPLAGSIMDKFHLFGHGTGGAGSAAHNAATTGTGGAENATGGAGQVYGPPAPTELASGDTFVVPDKGGVWHIAQKALESRGYSHNVYAVDRLKDMMLENPEKFGINEIIPRAVERGGFWLHRGADAVIPKSVVDSVIAEADKFATAKKIATAAVKGAAHVARAKVAV